MEKETAFIKMTLLILLFSLFNIVPASLMYSQNIQKKNGNRDFNPYIDNRLYHLWRYSDSLMKPKFIKGSDKIKFHYSKNNYNKNSKNRYPLTSYTNYLIYDDQENGKLYKLTENSIAANDNLLLNSNNADYSDEGFKCVDFFTSQDGINWSGDPTPQQFMPEGGSKHDGGDPCTGIDNESNNLYVTSLMNSKLELDPDHLWWPIGINVRVSTDGGINWQTNTLYPSTSTISETDVVDKEHFIIDNFLDSPYKGNKYLAWTKFYYETGYYTGDIEFCKVDNGFPSSTTVLNITTDLWQQNPHYAGWPQGVNIQTGLNGEVYTIFGIYNTTIQDMNKFGHDFSEHDYGFNYSLNGGTSFVGPYSILNRIRSQNPSFRFNGIRGNNPQYYYNNFRMNSFPSMAVDKSYGPYRGELYFVWTNITNPNLGEDPPYTDADASVYLISSPDGESWSEAVKVNTDDPTPGYYPAKFRMFPWISCDENSGVLATIYYDNRNTFQNSTSNGKLNDNYECSTFYDCTDVFVSLSYDGGLTWTDNQVNTTFFVPNPCDIGLCGQGNLDYFADYIGVTISKDWVFPVWTTTRVQGIIEGAQTWTAPFPLWPCEDHYILTDQINDIRKYKASSYIQASNLITSGQYSVPFVEYTAGSYIQLVPGFHAISSISPATTFSASIKSCETQFENKSSSITTDSRNANEKEFAENNSQVHLYKNAIKIFPNPSTGKFSIENLSRDFDVITFSVENLMQQEVFSGKMEGSNSMVINLEKYPKGIYFLKYLKNNKISVEKIQIY